MICVAATLAEIWTGQGTRWNRRRRWQCERQGTSRVVLQATQLRFTETTWNLWLSSCPLLIYLGKTVSFKKKGGWIFLSQKVVFLDIFWTPKKTTGKVHTKTAHRSPCDLRSQTHPTDFISTSKTHPARWVDGKKTQKKTSFWTHLKKKCRDF